MRLLDRITGQPLNGLPEMVYSGRYLLRQKATLNRHTLLEVDSLLSTDGSSRCQLEALASPFATTEKDAEADLELFRDAVTSIVRLMAAGDEHPSPLMPAAIISEQGHVNALEQQLAEVLRKGHLHSIAKRPRIDLKYEEAVTEVSRARRLTSSTYTHLASHSECWQSMSLLGVTPRKVLARFSEDDYSIYENRVYARLLDELDKYLTRRLKYIQALRDGLEEALEFSQSAVVHYLLRDEICALWGGTYSPGQTEQQLKETLTTLETVSAQHKCIRGLKQGGLYLQVPRSLQVGASLHRTNILTHDQHYRHVALLWDELHNACQQANRTPAQVLAANQQLELDYSVYTGLVLRQALLRYVPLKDGSTCWANHQISIRQDGLNWQLMVDNNTKLELVPWACSCALPDDTKQLPSQRVICWPGIELEDSLDTVLIGCALRVSPMDLYVVERMGALVDQVLSRVMLAGYALPVMPLPGPVVVAGQMIKGLKVQGNQLQVLNHLADEDAANMRASFVKHARPELGQAFDSRLKELQALSCCPVCAATSELTAQSDGGFSSVCKQCETKRYWRKVTGIGWEYQQLLKGIDIFRENGRRSMTLVIDRKADDA